MDRDLEVLESSKRDVEMWEMVRKHATSGEVKDQNVIIACGYLMGWISRLEAENKDLRNKLASR